MQKHLMAPAIATALALSLGVQTSIARAQDASSASTAKMPESSGQQELSLADILDLRLSTIASGTIKPIAKAAAIATVITAKDIEAMGARTFEEALDKVPGLHVSNSAAIMSPKILVRGSVSTYNPEILVMINGVPFTSLVKGDRFDQLGVLPVSMISRIEVIRGPGSALYGAEALMGVINVITKSGPEINGTVAGYRSESFNTNVGWLQHGGIYGEHRYAVMANYMNSDGQKRVIERDALYGTATTRAPGPVALQRESVDLVINSEIGRWTFDGQYRSVSNGAGAGVADSLDPISTGVYQRAMLTTKYDNPNFTDDLRVEGRLAFSYASQEIGGNGLMLFPPGTNIGTGTFTNGMVGKPEYAQRMWYFDTSATYKSLKNHLIRIGVGGVLGQLSMVKEIKNFTSGLAPRSGYVDVTDTSEAFMPKKRRDNYHAILQDEWRFAKDWELTAGLRFDHFSDFGDTVNPRL
ncbi:MAG TPA: TonB-dependent receptor, partial [Pseudobdellovibrionaceae bacterium]|nr:TonB-dependent receptor [Pseudobdellovibrionaceae bacterium]